MFASTKAQVHITIEDINDNAPEFYKCGLSCKNASHFTGEALEHSLGSISINMTVKDTDKVSTSARTPSDKCLSQSNRVTPTIFLKTPRTQLILEGEDKDVFSLEPQSLVSSSIVQLQVKQSENLDYEVKQQMILKVRKTMSKSRFSL